MVEEHVDNSESQLRPAGVRRRDRSTWAPVFVCTVILCIVAIARTFTSVALRNPAGDPLAAVSDSELVKRFRQALESYENMTDVFRSCVLEIERRRMLADLALEQIRELLGEPDAEGWVYVDQRVLEKWNPLKRLIAKRGSSWTYFHRSEIEETRYFTTVVKERTVAYELVFDGQVLSWTIFADEVGIDIVEEKTFYYAMDPPDQGDP